MTNVGEDDSEDEEHFKDLPDEEETTAEPEKVQVVNESTNEMEVKYAEDKDHKEAGEEAAEAPSPFTTGKPTVKPASWIHRSNLPGER